MFSFIAAILFSAVPAFAQALPPETVMVEGDDFRIPETQDIYFVPLKKSDPGLFGDPSLPRVLDLKSFQSQVKSQGARGACTYFVFTSLVESLVKRATGRTIDLSEEYLAWAGKTKKNLRVRDEGSSVSLNAAVFQEFGFMLESDMPYQPSWFEKGYPCEGQQGNPDADPICFSHYGPESSKPIYSGRSFVFEAVDSSSIDVVRALARGRSPVTLSLMGHRDMWSQSKKSGDFFLSAEHKKACLENRRLCSGHAVLAVGYDLDRRVVFIKNSWGTEWGDHGYGTIPFDYLDQMSDRKFLTGRLKQWTSF